MIPEIKIVMTVIKGIWDVVTEFDKRIFTADEATAIKDAAKEAALNKYEEIVSKK